MCMCNKCMKVTGILALIAGILFVLVDLGTWDFWGIQWWTVVFLIVGVSHFASSGCKDCQAIRSPALAAAKKKR